MSELVYRSMTLPDIEQVYEIECSCFSQPWSVESLIGEVIRNDAASYVQELTGEEANIIFGAMYDDTVADYCRITVIATGLNDDNLQQTPFGKRSTASSFGARRPSSTATTGTATAGTTAGSGMNMPSFSLPTMNATPFGASKAPSSTVQKKDIQIPDFLRNR